MQPSFGITRRSRALFSWDARDLSLTARTGEVGSLVRATTGGMVLDRHRRLWLPIHSQPRFEMTDPNGTGAFDTPGLLLEAARTQICPNPQIPNLWSSNSTPVVTTGIADPWGGSNAILIEDDDAASAEGKQVVVPFTTDGTKSVVVAIRAGTLPNLRIHLQDTTASVTRRQFSVTWNGGTTAPTLGDITGTGTLFTPIGVYDRTGALWWLIPFCADGIVAANTNRIRVLSSLVADLGTVYLAGANAWDASVPASWQPSDAHLRGAEALQFAHTARPQESTFYLSWRDRGAALISSARLAEVGSSNGTGARLYVQLYQLEARVRMFHLNDTGANVNSFPSTTFTLGDAGEALGWLFSDGSVQLTVCKNGGAEVAASRSGPLAFASAWAEPKLTLNATGALATHGASLFHRALLVPGIRSFAEMREII